MPFAGDVVWDMGYKARIVRGQGQFTGKNAMQEYSRLLAVYNEQGAGLLALPEQKPFAAFFTVLAVTGEAQPFGVSYSFEFVEDTKLRGRQTAAERILYIAAENDTLFSIAARHRVTVEQLLALNPDIASPNSIRVGQTVIVAIKPWTYSW